MSSRYALTSGMAETSDARMEISGVLMRPVTSSPLRYICCVPSSPYPKRISSLGSSSTTGPSSPSARPALAAARPTVLYIAPVST